MRSSISTRRSAVLWPKRHKYFPGKIAIRVDRAMPSVVPSSVADAKLAEKKAWRRYAEARDDNWREALAQWVEARNALLAAYAEEAASLHRF